MTRTKLTGNADGTEQKKSATLNLRTKVGTKVIGTFMGRIESKAYPGTFTALIAVEDTDGETTMWDKEKEKAIPVDIQEGETVFLKENTILSRVFATLTKGDRIEVVYQGKGKAKAGRKAAILFDVFRLGE